MPASVDDREGLRDFAENHLWLTVLSDKGYTGERLLEDMQEKGICLMSLKPSNHKNNWPKEVRQMIFRFRRRIETVFSQLSEQLNAEKVLAKSFRGLYTRLQNKILVLFALLKSMQPYHWSHAYPAEELEHYREREEI